MQTPRPFWKSPAALSLIAAAALAACGGGGSDSSTAAAATSLDDPTVTAYSADATQVGSDTATAADTAVLSAQLVIASASTAMPTSAPDATALAMPLDASASKTVACAGGGTAVVTASGGTLASLANGQLDAGEVYHLAFAACTGAAGYAALNGTLDLTVQAASGDSSNGTLGLSMTATALGVTLPHGAATLDGTTTRTLTAVTGSDAVTHLTSHFVSSSLTLATQFNGRSSSFTLAAVDITRMAAFSGGVIQSSSVSGTHSLTATTPDRSFSYTVATTGGASYGADGKPISGNWTITLPDSIITVSLANGSVTLTFDKNKDGTIDRTIVLTRDQLFASAG
jgi:hypothetical protein